MATSSQSSTQQSEGTSTSTSSSRPIAISTRENEIINALSKYAEGLARQMHGWAQQTFAKTSQITDQAVGNFFETSKRMSEFGGNLTDQYNNLFAPQNRQLIQEANSFNSDARQRVEMGKAGATQAQAGDQAMRNSEEALRSFGINPSDGRYAALNKAAEVQNAANVAGAMNVARDRTAQTGRDLRTQAVQVGAQLPAAIANVQNTAIQANTGASNASLANANTGANLMRVPNDYLRTAMDVKLPPIGQDQRSQSNSQNNSRGSSTGQSFSPDRSSSGGSSSGGRAPGGGGYGGAGGGGGGPAWMPQHGNAQAGYGGGGGRFVMPSASIRHYGGGGGSMWDDYDTSDPLAGVDFSYLNEGQSYEPQPYNDYGGQYDNWGFDQYDFSSNGWDDTYGGGGDYNTFGNSDYPDWAYDGSYGNIAYDPGQNNDYSGWAQDNGWQTYDTPVQADWPSIGQSYDTSSPDSDYYAGDWSGNYDDYGGVFARGGAVPGYDGGGNVPPQMSPSGGQQVDDIPAVMPGGPARLNANEFVIPQDVALWKGQEFFQKLIEQSRKHRVTAPAQPQMG